ncbi:Peroxisomal membrane protein PMP27 [Orbilia blumenaviensis]|uniref:Peroxisomal membrane protein PMP27 n=1 Tax=Orbilia blumenaviensis TaxID=1796055 RepID=A0AAV9VNS5_9PEZI
MVADALTYHPTVSHFLKFLSTTVGRDKLLRLIQYVSRFLSFYLYRKGYSAAVIAPFDAIKKQFGMTRKLMRIGKNVESFKSASLAYDEKAVDPVLKYAAVGRHLGYAGYLTLDSIHYLDSSGIMKFNNAKRLSDTANKFWFTGLVFSIASSVYTLRRIAERHASLNKQEAEHSLEEKKLVKDQKAVKKQLLSDVCDITIPGYALSTYGFNSLDDGIVGLAGTVSSVIGCLAAWDKTA